MSIYMYTPLISVTDLQSYTVSVEKSMVMQELHKYAE